MTSRAAHRADGLVVLDEVLPLDAFRALGRDAARGDYRRVHAQRWDKAWRLWDGEPLRGESVYFDPRGAFGWAGAVYPTGAAVDRLIDAVRAAAAAAPDIAGVEGRDWIGLYLAPWIYPVGSALAQHQDNGRYAGSFAFFAHARWSLHWGGELVVAPPAPAGLRGDAAWLSDDAHDLADDPGIATSIPPRPNRLVLLAPDRPHRIARVDPNAGAHVRASLAGFFLRAPAG